MTTIKKFYLKILFYRAKMVQGENDRGYYGIFLLIFFKYEDMGMHESILKESILYL